MEKQIEEIANKWFEEQGLTIYHHYNAKPAFIAGYKAALSKAEYKGECCGRCVGECYLDNEVESIKLTSLVPREPTNSLDELERWVKEQYQGDQEKGSDAIIVGNNILRLVIAKIQSLKTITT